MVRRILLLFLILGLFFVSCEKSLPEETRKEVCSKVEYAVSDVQVNNMDNKISIIIRVKNQGDQVIKAMEYRIKYEEDTGIRFTGYHRVGFDNKLSPEQQKDLFINYPEVPFDTARELILYPVVELDDMTGVCREKEKKIDLEDYKGGIRIRIE